MPIGGALTHTLVTAWDHHWAAKPGIYFKELELELELKELNLFQFYIASYN